jgi:hypothetical protein
LVISTESFIKNAAPQHMEKKKRSGKTQCLLHRQMSSHFTPPNVFPFSHPVDKGVIETLKKNTVTDFFTNLQKFLQKKGKCRKI